MSVSVSLLPPFLPSFLLLGQMPVISTQSETAAAFRYIEGFACKKKNLNS